MKSRLHHELQRTAASLTKIYRTIVIFSKKRPLHAALLGAAGLLIATPILYLFILLIINSINIPFWDQWIYVDLVDKWRHNTLGISDLWHQHNEHRIFIPKLFQVLLSDVTGWNIRAEVMMNFMIGLGSFTVMTALLRRTFRGRIIPLLIAAAVTAWLFFSPVQYINWIWGFQLAWFLSVLAVVTSVWALTKYDAKNGFDRWFIVALVTSLVATFSMANGMLMWVIGMGLLFYKQAARNQYIAWAATGAIAIGLYFYHLVRPDDQPSPFWLVRHRAADLIDYALQYLGRNLAFTPSVAKNTGIALLVLLGVNIVLLIRKKRLGIVVPWLAIASYGLVTALLAALSRMHSFGVNHSMVYSYTTMSVLFVIGTLVVTIYTATVYLEKAPVGALRKYLVIAFALGILAFPFAGNFWYNYTDGARQLKGLGLHLSKVRDCVFTVTSRQDPCLDIVYPDRDTAWKHIHTLRDLNWDHLGEESKLPKHKD